MALYRGAGGSGDAVNDAASEVVLAVTAKNAAIAAQVAAETAQTAAQTSATNASTSATSAASSATAASTSASNAATSATNASNSASAASTSATNASNSASAASTSATNASNSASSASTSATNASNSATSASTSASNASTSASSAATSATAASNAQTAAETARDQTLTAYDNFDDRYLGAKTSDPTLDNDGNALVAGALYFNSTGALMKVYTGSVWVDAYAAGSSFLAKTNNLSDLPSASTARTNLGLGSAATTSSTDYATAAQGTKADSALQPATIGVSVQAYDADLATIAGLTPTNNYAIIGNGTSWTSSALPTSLPSQTSNSGKFLKTDGSTASWQFLPTVLPILDRSGASISVSVGNGVLPILNRSGSTVNVAIN